ncbi:GNAT family N-acetyltransferase [Flavobacterium branchiarum]|uniref:GNAT family N-acetyltransferase n=1 Tax=Flavobacterium branchiarum TaxID=1114870 RepID=A0ABV5FMA8_9FLAO|nr:GNAT family N-acetyltransferase [Flavobacterium branchiarum]MDN3674678.1 GNAT family N-acetyltransferase [Flavobacterium branchiarum]
MSLHNYSLIELKSDTIINNFNCDDTDLNDFLLSKAKDFSSELLATTYLLEKDNTTIAYYSVFNDSLRIEESNFNSKSSFKKFFSNFLPHRKRYLKNIPAIKIGRLAVSVDGKGQGIGKKIIDNIISFCLSHNTHCACKLITVDAYRESLGFYEKMGFEYLSDKDEDDDTRQMYIDLTPYFNTEEESLQN